MTKLNLFILIVISAITKISAQNSELLPFNEGTSQFQCNFFTTPDPGPCFSFTACPTYSSTGFCATASVIPSATLTLYVNGVPYNITTVSWGFGRMKIDLPPGALVGPSTSVYLSLTCAACSPSAILSNTVIAKSLNFSFNNPLIPCQTNYTLVPTFNDDIVYYFGGSAVATSSPIFGMTLNGAGLANSDFNTAGASVLSTPTLGLFQENGSYVAPNDIKITSSTTYNNPSVKTQILDGAYQSTQVGFVRINANALGTQYRYADNLHGTAASQTEINIPGAPNVALNDIMEIQSTNTAYNFLINSTPYLSVSKQMTLTASGGTISPSITFPGQPSVWTPPNTVGTYTIFADIGSARFSQTFTISALPFVTTPSFSTTSLCSGTPLNINLGASIPATYSWSANNNTNITGASITTETASILSNTLINNSNINQTITYTITPKSTAIGGCTGTRQLLTVTVYPIPFMSSPNTATICGDAALNIPLNSAAAATYNWVATDNTNTLGESLSVQNTALINDVIVNSSANEQYVMYDVTPQGTAGSCLGATQQVTVTVNPKPIMSSANTGTICSGNTFSLNLISNTPANYIWSATDNINTVGESTTNQTTTSINQTITSTSAFAELITYTVTPTSTIAGCLGSSQTITVTVNAIPETTASTTGSITCVANTVNLNSTLAGMNYTWTAPGGSSISGSPNLQGAVGQGLGTYTLNILSPAGCSYSTTVAAIQNTTAPTSVNAGTNQTLICGVPTVTLSGSATPGTATANWLGGVTSPTNFTTTTGSAGTYTLQAINPATGCFITSTVQVTSSIGAPTATTNAITNSITCTNSIVTIGITPTSAGPFTYQWPSAGISGATTNATATATLAGVYNVTLTNSPGNNCSIQISITVPTNTTPVSASINPSSTITCSVPSLTLTALPGGPHTYTWTGSSALSNPSSQNPGITDGGTYSVSISNTINGCVGSANITVASNTVLPVVNIAAPSVTTTCSNPTEIIVASSTPATGVTYSWASPGTGSLSQSNISNPVASGSGIFTVVVTNTASGCNSSLTQNTVQVTPDLNVPVVTLSTNAVSITCSNPTPSVAITTTASPVSYSWTPTIGIVPGTETTANPSFNSAGLYSVVVTNTVSGCATSISSNVVDVTLDNAAPSITLSLTGNNGTITCTNTFVTIAPIVTPTANLTYTWSPSGVTSSSINDATFTTAGIYTLVVTNTLTGCVSSSTNTANTYTVTDISGSITSSINTTSTNTIIGCGASNSSVTLQGNSSSTAPSYTWMPGGITTQTFAATTAGDYTLNVQDVNSGCSSFTVITVSGSTLTPQGVNAGTSANIACGNSTVTLNGVTTTSNTSFSWSGPSATSIVAGTETTANPTATEVGDYTLTVTDNVTGCSATANVNVTQAIATASITANPTSGISPLDVAFTGAGAGTPSFSWNFGDGNTSPSQTPNHTFTTGTYTVTLTTLSGSCTATARVEIVVEDGFTLVIPNVFTPNNDGSNDNFTIKSTGIKEISLQVFNRWGEKLYEFAGPKAAWDGLTNQGGKVPEGTYFYFVKATGFDGTEIEKNGTVNLFR
ncbi:MAG: gliding motility-associated C-terminal domain-containing protein [Burkholderiales bacterium]|nr:gliding motility-associated C-terminal domain-containing protein [Bacteroidia bacterium]